MFSPPQPDLRGAEKNNIKHFSALADRQQDKSLGKTEYGLLSHIFRFIIVMMKESVH